MDNRNLFRQPHGWLEYFCERRYELPLERGQSTPSSVMNKFFRVLSSTLTQVYFPKVIYSMLIRGSIKLIDDVVTWINIYATSQRTLRESLVARCTCWCKSRDIIGRRDVYFELCGN